jgi:hypothetical protein
MRDSLRRLFTLTIIGSIVAGTAGGFTAPARAASRPSSEPNLPAIVRPAAPHGAPVALSALSTLPIQFEANLGQAPGDVRYFARIGQHRLLLTDREAVLDLRTPNTTGKPGMATPGRRNPSTMERHVARVKGARELAQQGVLRMQFVGGKPTRPATEAALPGVVNYYLGKDPKNWRLNVPTYGRVRYHDVYPGIDVVYYGKGVPGGGGAFEYDFVVAPGADPRRIRIAFQGAESQRLDVNGDVVLSVDGREVRHRKPDLYQDVAGVRRTVPGRYVVAANGEIGFEVGAYLASAPLVIDPVTFIPLGNGGVGFPEKAIGDPSGNSYVTGFTTSTLPTPVPASSRCVDFPDIATDAFLVKLDAQNAVAWTVIVGGRDANGFNDCTGTFGLGLAIDSTAANVVFVGATNSPNMVVTNGTNVLTSPPAFQQTLGDDTCFLTTLVPGNPLYQSGGDGFVVKITAAGALSYATYLGGNLNDFAQAVAIDTAGNAYVTGGTQSQAVTRPPSCAGAFPTFPSQYGGILNLTQAAGGFSDVFMAKLNVSGSVANFVTLQGSTGDDAGIGVVLNGQGEAVVSADTLSTLALGASLAISGSTATMGVTNPKAPQTRFVLRRDGTTTLFDQIVAGGETPTHTLSATGLTDGTHTLALTVTDPTGETATASATFTVTGGTIATVQPFGTTVAAGAGSAVERALRIESMMAATDVPAVTRLGGIEAGLLQLTVPCPDQLPDGSTFQSSNYRGANRTLLGTATAPYVSTCDAENAVIAKFSTTTGAATVAPALIGGSSADAPVGIGVDAGNNVYIAGQTASPNFPVANEITGTAGTPDPAKERLAAGAAFVTAFVMKITLPAANSAAPPAAQYSSLLGGSGETTVSGLAVTPAGAVFVSGVTTSTDPEVNVVPKALDPETPTAYIVQIPAPATPTTAPKVAEDDHLLVAAATSGATLAISADIDGNVMVTGAPDDGGTLGIKLTATIDVAVDIKPRARKNNLNLRSRYVQVAVLSTPFFDAPARVDPASLTFGQTGDEASLVRCDKKPRDVNKGRRVNTDKIRDLVCTFRIAATGLAATDTAAILKGKTKAGADIVGSDLVTIVPKKNNDRERDCDDDDKPWDDRDDRERFDDDDHDRNDRKHQHAKAKKK